MDTPLSRVDHRSSTQFASQYNLECGLRYPANRGGARPAARLRGAEGRRGSVGGRCRLGRLGWWADGRRVGLVFGLFRGGLAPEDGDDVIDGDHEELIIGVEIDGDGIFGMEEDFVVLPQRDVLVVLDLMRNRDDTTRDRGDFGLIRQRDAPLGFPFRFVFAHDDAHSDRFDVFHSLVLGVPRIRHRFSTYRQWVPCSKNNTGQSGMRGGRGVSDPAEFTRLRKTTHSSGREQGQRGENLRGSHQFFG